MIDVVFGLVFRGHVWQPHLDALDMVRAQSLKCVFADDEISPELLEFLPKDWSLSREEAIALVLNVVEPSI